MPRRALRPSLVVTFALGACAIAGGCSTADSHGNPPSPPYDGGGDTSIGDGSVGDGSPGDGSIGDGGCPAEQPAQGAPCDLPSSVTCVYGTCTPPDQPAGPDQTSECQQGKWLNMSSGCNPPPPADDVTETFCTADDAGSFTCWNGAPGPGQSATCNACIQSEGCESWCACGANSTVDDAGTIGGCIGYVNCVILCYSGDAEAGVPPGDAGLPGCFAQCAGDGGSYTATQQAEAQAIIQVLAMCPSCAGS